MNQKKLFGGSIFKNLKQWLNPVRRNKLVVWGTNVASLPSKAEDMRKLLSEKKPDVVLINETWLKDENSFTHESYHVIATNFQQQYQGTCILLRKNDLEFLSCHQVAHPTKNLTEIILKIDIENKIHFLAAYLPPVNKEERQEVFTAMEQSLKYFEGKNHIYIGYGDLNARLREIERSQFNGDDKFVLKWFSDQKLQLLYDSGEGLFTRSNDKHKTYIDYFFERNGATLKSQNNEVVDIKNLRASNLLLLDPVGISDHKVLQVDLKLSRPLIRKLYLMLLGILLGLLTQKESLESIKQKLLQFTASSEFKVLANDQVQDTIKEVFNSNVIQTTIKEALNSDVIPDIIKEQASNAQQTVVAAAQQGLKKIGFHQTDEDDYFQEKSFWQRQQAVILILGMIAILMIALRRFLPR